ncbi:hypothetical protein ACH5AJ_35320 [Streptomyces rochei]|uniref:hypothetical protein n=1 Tax=Streptomyces rochei TaxID=1928 RepID=UPI0037B8E355
MASSSNREGDELETPVGDRLRVAGCPIVAAIVPLGGAASAAAESGGDAEADIVASVVALVVAGGVAALAGAVVLGGAVAGGAVAGGAGVLVAVVVVLDRASEGNAGPRHGSGGAMLMRGAAGLLPGWAACRYREEWAGELYDLRAEGAPWWRRAGYILGILLFSAPRLAVGLRLGGERSRA